MKLGELFRGEVHRDRSSDRIEPQSVRGTHFNRWLNSLTPGQTLQGEVLSRQDNELQIKLSEDYILQARVDAGVHLEEGQQVIFEVKNTGNTLTLSPLFTNIASDANVLRALEMAELPVTGESVEMTEQLMKAGLPVNRTMLQQVFREVRAYPLSPLADLVNLHRMSLPVNQHNLEQMAAYRNLEHQLIGGMEAVFEGLAGTLQQTMEGKDAGLAMPLLRGLAGLVSESLTPAATNAVPIDMENLLNSGNPATHWAPEAPEGAAMVGNPEAPEGAVIGGNPEAPEGAAMVGNPEAPPGAAMVGNPEAPPGAVIGGNPEAPGATVTSGNPEMPGATVTSGNPEVPEATVIIRNSAAKGDPAEAGKGLTPGSGLFPDSTRQLLDALKEQWMLLPKEVSDPEKLKELYHRLHRQLQELKSLLEGTGHQDSGAYRAVSGLQQNIDFLQQINQAYTYLQLPLKFQESEAHGELYVYTNKRNLAEKKGEISALLHLNMKHLGPMDVYVKLGDSGLSTNFYVADESILDFVEQHMDLLTKRLEEKGYSLKVRTAVRGSDADGQTTGLQPLLGADKPEVVTRYAFDMRA